MCFSPYLTSWSVTAAQVGSLMDDIAPYTHWIRTFGSEDEADAMPAQAKARGLQIAQGADIWSDLTHNQNEVNQLVAQVKRGDVTTAIVGDEVLENNACTEDQMLSYISQVKAAGATVSTSMSYTEWPKRPRIVAACDFLTANIYPYWDEASIDNGLSQFVSDYNQVKAVAGGKKIVVETGWPTAGQTNGGAVASSANAAKYLNDFAQWATTNSVEYFYFEAFDESWKTEGGCGPHWGLWTTAASLKPEYASVLKPWR